MKLRVKQGRLIILIIAKQVICRSFGHKAELIAILSLMSRSSLALALLCEDSRIVSVRRHSEQRLLVPCKFGDVKTSCKSDLCADIMQLQSSFAEFLGAPGALNGDSEGDDSVASSASTGAPDDDGSEEEGATSDDDVDSPTSAEPSILDQ